MNVHESISFHGHCSSSTWLNFIESCKLFRGELAFEKSVLNSMCANDGFLLASSSHFKRHSHSVNQFFFSLSVSMWWKRVNKKPSDISHFSNTFIWLSFRSGFFFLRDTFYCGCLFPYHSLKIGIWVVIELCLINQTHTVLYSQMRKHK